MNTERNRYGQQEDDFIIRFAKAGESCKNVAVTLDRTTSGIYARYQNYLRHQNPDLPQDAFRNGSFGPKAGESQIPEIVKLANEGVTFWAIAKRLKLSPSTIRRRYNEACPPADRTTGNGSPDWTEQDVELVKQRMREGKPKTSIAFELRRTVGSVRALIVGRKLNVRSSAAKRFTREEDDAIRRALSTKSSIASIAKQLDRRYDSVSCRIRSRSFLMPDPHAGITRFTLKDREKMIQLHEQGHTVPEIASRMGKTDWGTRQNLQSALLKLGDDSPSGNRKWTPEKVTQLLSLRDDESLSWNAVATSMKETKKVVKNKYYRIKGTINRKWTPEEVTKLMRLRDDEGLSWDAISTSMNATKRGIQGKYYHIKNTKAQSTSCDSSLQETAVK